MGGRKNAICNIITIVLSILNLNLILCYAWLLVKFSHVLQSIVKEKCKSCRTFVQSMGRQKVDCQNSRKGLSIYTVWCFEGIEYISSVP